MDKERICILFGKRLQSLRIQKGITPSQFYKSSGIRPETLAQYEEGKLEPMLLTIATMAKALGVSQVELMDIGVDDIDH